jgi:hypothetical protein
MIFCFRTDDEEQLRPSDAVDGMGKRREMD